MVHTDNYLTTSVQVLPNTVLSIAHGHQARGGGNAQQKVVNWFTKMSSKKLRQNYTIQMYY